MAGCSARNDAEIVQRQLDGYALSALSGQGLERYLSGDALASALQTKELMQSLGYQQLGRVRPELERADAGVGFGCLDLSDATVVDQAGRLVQVNRIDRISFQIRYDEDFRISNLEVGGSC